MIPILVAAGYRVIVPDFIGGCFKSLNKILIDFQFPLIGFGKSDKYTNPDNYTHELHCFTLRKLLDHLDVRF